MIKKSILFKILFFYTVLFAFACFFNDLLSMEYKSASLAIARSKSLPENPASVIMPSSPQSPPIAIARPKQRIDKKEYAEEILSDCLKEKGFKQIDQKDLINLFIKDREKKEIECDELVSGGSQYLEERFSKWLKTRKDLLVTLKSQILKYNMDNKDKIVDEDNKLAIEYLNNNEKTCKKLKANLQVTQEDFLKWCKEKQLNDKKNLQTIPFGRSVPLLIQNPKLAKEMQPALEKILN